MALTGVVLGGINGGVFTPTEAAAVYAFVTAVLVHRDMRLRDVPRMLLNAANTSATVLPIIADAVLLPLAPGEGWGEGAGKCRLHL
ncbi:MAG TPA: TRAP transporter large permease subunit [Acetobacteraceae bacterium]